jgi:hypothetical protein
MESSLEQSTLSSQRSAVKSWTRFMDCMRLGDPLMIGLQLQAVESIVIRYLSFEIGLRGMNPRSINKTYLGGIASHFVRIGARNHFQDAVVGQPIRKPFVDTCSLGLVQSLGHLESWLEALAKSLAGSRARATAGFW